MSNNQANRTETRREDWGTPLDLFAKLSRAHDFAIDLCASSENSLCSSYVTEFDDLMSPKADELVQRAAENAVTLAGYAWINPPYRGGWRCAPPQITSAVGRGDIEHVRRGLAAFERRKETRENRATKGNNR